MVFHRTAFKKTLAILRLYLIFINVIASVSPTISEMISIAGSSLKIMFDVVTAWRLEHNLQVKKASKENPRLLIKLPRALRHAEPFSYGYKGK